MAGTLLAVLLAHVATIERTLAWTILVAVGLTLLAVLVWDYVWINLMKSGSVESP